MGYLAMALSLTSFCYCSGLFLAWRRRRTFKTYEEVVEEDKKKSDKTTVTYESDIRSSELKDNKTDESGIDTETGKEVSKNVGKRKTKKLQISTDGDTDDQTPLLKEHGSKEKDTNIKRQEEKLSVVRATESEEDKEKSGPEGSKIKKKYANCVFLYVRNNFHFHFHQQDTLRVLPL